MAPSAGTTVQHQVLPSSSDSLVAHSLLAASAPGTSCAPAGIVPASYRIIGVMCLQGHQFIPASWLLLRRLSAFDMLLHFMLQSGSSCCGTWDTTAKSLY